MPSKLRVGEQASAGYFFWTITIPHIITGRRLCQESESPVIFSAAAERQAATFSPVGSFRRWKRAGDGKQSSKLTRRTGRTSNLRHIDAPSGAASMPNTGNLPEKCLKQEQLINTDEYV